MAKQATIEDETPDPGSYFIYLYPRIERAELVRLDQNVRIGDWTPLPKVCHENVDRWCADKLGRLAVRGWLRGATGGMGSYLLISHSVVEEHGELYDITPEDGTPIGPPTPRWFIRHPGPKETFDSWAKQPQFSSRWVHRPW